ANPLSAVGYQPHVLLGTEAHRPRRLYKPLLEDATVTLPTARL
ncbi:MAG: hypothetical protein AVDCRST_MAG80-1278, partial [uncultured Rubrobacteraceae bacterium]